MKQVIDGLVYDTDKATLVAKWYNGLTCSDVNYCLVKLYITKSGRFFFMRDGGDFHGTKLSVVEKDEAQQWCEEHRIDAETIMQYFETEAA